MSTDNYPNDPVLRDSATGVITQVSATGTLPDLAPSTNIFSKSLTPGGVIATLSDPFANLGLGTTIFSLRGYIPPQLAISGNTIIKGAAAAGLTARYSVAVLAVSGDGSRQKGHFMTFYCGN